MTAPAPAAAEPPPTGREVIVGMLLVGLVLLGAFGALIWVTRGTDGPEDPPLSLDFATAIILQNAGFLAAAMPLAVTRRRRAGAAIGFVPARGRDVLVWGAVVIGIAFLLRQLVAVFQEMTGRPVEVPAYDVMMTGLDDLGLPLMLLLAAGLAPFAEEVAFRGVVFSWLRRHLPFWPAAVLQALPFGILHIQVDHVLYATLLGTMLALARERGRSLWVPVVIHIAINTIAVAAIYLGVEVAAGG
jgi:membrane protease YdiL (CAAX protease family)